MPKINFIKVIIAVIVCELAGVIGSVFTFSSIPNWYAYLNKPFFNPPNWIFGPVWTTLYALMGVALYIVWQNKEKVFRKTGLVMFSIQLVLNSLWSIVFFGMQDLRGGLLVIALLWVFIVLTIVYFWRISRVAGALLLPYIAWVSFASILNYYLLILN
jgi:tryptophan-rich sensory protein